MSEYVCPHGLRVGHCFGPDGPRRDFPTVTPTDPEMPQTAAGRALSGPGGYMVKSDVVRIEVEAAAARDAEVRALVEALEPSYGYTTVDDEMRLEARLSRAAVLAILSDTGERR